MKKISLLMCAAATLLWSCEKKQTTEVAGSEIAASAATPSDSASGANSAAQTQEITTANPNTASQSTAVVTNSTPGNKPALNPAHGEPYHRCDIAVGAPINSAAKAQNSAPQVVPQQAPANSSFNTSPIAPSLNTPSASSQNAGPKPSLNPAHGEPHHRCDLQVGAPLT